MNISVERLGEDDWQILRDLRLAALADAPYAFWATLEDEAAFDRSRWTGFLRAAAWFVARDGNEFAGIAAGLVRDAADDEPELISMWVAPAARRTGTGRLLLAAFLDWARARGAPAVTLWFTEGNDRARRLYENSGFRLTGERGDVPHDAATQELRMRLRLVDDAW